MLIGGCQILGMVYTDLTCFDQEPIMAPYIFVAVQKSFEQTASIFRASPDFNTVELWVGRDKMPNNEYNYGKNLL